jgi:hypothetical protein
MSTHHVDTKLTEDGKLTLNDLQFHAGEAVEMIIMSSAPKAPSVDCYPLRAKPIPYIEPTNLSPERTGKRCAHRDDCFDRHAYTATHV